MNEDVLAFYNNKKILITGGRGYLGSGLTNMLGHVGCKIIRLGRSGFVQSTRGIKADLTDIKGDIRDKKTWIDNLEGIDFVFHFAAQTSVYKAEQDAFEDFRSNVLPMLHLLDVCKKNKWQPSVLYAGTVTEAGIPTAIPVGESYPDQPVTVYDLHKLMAEKYLRYYANQEFVRGVVLRLANVYGPGPKSSSADRGILNMMMRKALVNEPLTVYGKGDFLRDYIYVEDVISAFLRAGIYMEQLNGKHFVIGSGEGHTITQAINLVADRAALKTGRRVAVKHIEPPSVQSPIEQRNFVADTRQFALAAGWHAQYSLKDGIDKTLEILVEHTHDYHF